MKMLKTLVCIFILITVLLSSSGSMLAFSPPPINTISISIEDASGSTGDILTVSLRISNVPSQGLSECYFQVAFDGYDLEILDIVHGEIVENEDNFNWYVSENSVIIFSFNDKTEGNELIKSNGEFAKITLRIKPTALKGSSFFRLGGVIQTIFKGIRTDNYGGEFNIGSNNIGKITIKNGIDNSLHLNIGKVIGCPGDIVEIPVSISNVPPLAKLRFALNYDSCDLEIISVSPGEAIPDSEFVDFSYELDIEEFPVLYGQGIIFNYSEKNQHLRDQQLLSDGKFAIITAKIKASTNKKFRPIRYVNPSYMEPVTFKNFNVEQIAPERIKLEITNGGITQFMVGDLNNDKLVNSTDYVILKRYILEIIDDIPVSNLLDVADLNSDGKIDLEDLVALKRYILKIDKELPFNHNRQEPYIQINTFESELFDIVNMEHEDISEFGVGVRKRYTCVIEDESIVSNQENLPSFYKGLMRTDTRYIFKAEKPGTTKITFVSNNNEYPDKIYKINVEPVYLKINAYQSEIFDIDIMVNDLADESYEWEIRNEFIVSLLDKNTYEEGVSDNTYYFKAENPGQTIITLHSTSGQSINYLINVQPILFKDNEITVSVSETFKLVTKTPCYRFPPVWEYRLIVEDENIIETIMYFYDYNEYTFEAKSPGTTEVYFFSDINRNFDKKYIINVEP
ncbi:UNVERIFIED_CONTAM: dockerin type I repeat protein [Acetivibrio alkalicellulosi]